MRTVVDQHGAGPSDRGEPRGDVHRRAEHVSEPGHDVAVREAAADRGELVLLVLAALVSIGTAFAASTAGQIYIDLLVDKWDGFMFWLENLLS